MQLAGDAQVRKAVAEHVRGGLAGILGQHHAGDAKTVRAEDVGQTKHVLVVRDAQIATSLVLLNVVGVDGDDDLASSTSFWSMRNLVSDSKPGRTREAW